MKPKSAAINLSLLAATAFFFFGGIEVILRVTGLQTVKPNPPKIYQTSDYTDISYELRPNIRKKAYRNTVTTNSLGFRSPEINASKDTVLILGDSIAFGYGVADHETLGAQLQTLLPQYNFLNTGTPGYHLGMETALYKEKLKDIPHSALMLVFHYNDFEMQTGWLDDLGIIRSPNFVPTATECSPITEGLLGLLPGKCWLDTHSAFYKAVKKLVNMRFAGEMLEEAREGDVTMAESHSISNEQMRMYLRQLDSLLRILPADMPKTFVIWPDRYLHEKSRPVLKAAVEKRGFTVVDLYDIFSNKVEVLGWDTVHPSARAVKQAAEVVAEKIAL
ncbi:hypothetical protein COU78_00665 [Candidatus Peregrinibacteria bacterium CG10_big_fil_rev_8_21_14_0_10_49_24]|nr:MAG: hypothetical protein COV83_00915 [Candidatus Peregrinibacteria bacterium CG11_big_fil_rev_8_21_14_0_20_49_14]PIR51466.1 MAG: hypothetical protein COU78_00665 [Candidatus Peregrinibacteria bacterium CG10_big_fil_rev_8_21_14_0_10_49_24]PJA67891.1 MAG: hypothetical protein CO157_02675 [Candidatus Peregrinibacteria bacterium CG_4_9_14_3_um_filter_49_12]